MALASSAASRRGGVLRVWQRRPSSCRFRRPCRRSQRRCFPRLHRRAQAVRRGIRHGIPSSICGGQGEAGRPSSRVAVVCVGCARVCVRGPPAGLLVDPPPVQSRRCRLASYGPGRVGRRATLRCVCCGWLVQAGAMRVQTVRATRPCASPVAVRSGTFHMGSPVRARGHSGTPGRIACVQVCISRGPPTCVAARGARSVCRRRFPATLAGRGA